MASSTRRPRKKYDTPGTANDNLARKLDSRELERRLERSGQVDFDQQYRQRRETEAERRSRQRAKAMAAVRPAQKVNILAVLAVLGIAALTVGVLLCYIQLNAISRNIVRMKTEITALEVEQVGLLTKYEQSFDLTSVKEAAESYGMVQPSESQIYNIELPGANQAVSHSGRRSAGSAESLLDRVLDKLRGLLE